MTGTYRLALVILLWLLPVLQAASQEGPAEEPARTGSQGNRSPSADNAVHVNPWGILYRGVPEVDIPISVYAAGYERRLTGPHGLMGEIVYTDRVSLRTVAGGIHYRYHLDPRLDSLFLGPFLRYSFSWGSVDGTAGQGSEQDFTAHGLVLGAGLGQRWVIGDAVSLAVRLGYGYTVLLIHTEEAQNPETDEDVQDLLRVPLAMDGELSIGWAF